MLFFISGPGGGEDHRHREFGGDSVGLDRPADQRTRLPLRAGPEEVNAGGEPRAEKRCSLRRGGVEELRTITSMRRPDERGDRLRAAAAAGAGRVVNTSHIQAVFRKWENRTSSARTSHELFQLRIICTSLLSKGKSKTQYLLHVEIEQAPVIKLHRTRRPVPECPAGCRLGLFRSLF